MKLFKNQKGFNDVITLAIIGGIIGALFITGTYIWQEMKQGDNFIVYKINKDSEPVEKKLGDFIEFSILDLDVEATKKYIQENKTYSQTYNINNVRKVIHKDLDGDSINEAIVEFDTDPYKTRDLLEQLSRKIIRPAHAGGWPTASIFGVFKYNTTDKIWRPIYMDYVAIGVWGCADEVEDCYDDIKGNKIPEIVRIEILNKQYGVTPEKPLKTDILIEKQSCSGTTPCKYILHFENLEFTKEEIE
ncbi:hypothetical protein HON36_00950 [Candidatus Parcubacteria bacterium]|jgi:hypothetical protein|nr:hypothetical protein [Candidatus Parcubacteria bacterium]MBT7228286.1 hypothetical protein [Candidatus Parcubacteria bacterium]